MSISPTGNGLNILISCEYRPHHSWMTFASWYSIIKHLPDARIKIYCVRTDVNEMLFSWTHKCNVPFSFNNDESNSLKITPDIMAVSAYNEKMLGPETVKSDENFTFVSYLNGCGKFVLNEWIDSIRNPFGSVDKLFSDDLKLNEYRILKMWEKCSKTYNAIV